jgi:hypothetical protein
MMVEKFLAPFFTIKTVVMSTTNEDLQKDKRRVKVWFPRSISLDKKNTGMKISERKRKIQNVLKKLLRNSRDGRFWEISSFKWSGPLKPSMKYRVVIFIKLKKKITGPIGPNDPTVPPPPKQPKSM